MMTNTLSLAITALICVLFLIAGLLDLADHFIVKTILFTLYGMVLLNYIIIQSKKLAKKEKDPSNE